MWQELRDYWLPLMLFAGTLLAATVLLLLVAVLPLIELPAALVWLDVFAEDATVRRTSIAGAVGLIVTAFTFFRPNASVLARKPSQKKPPGDTMAGA